MQMMSLIQKNTEVVDNVGFSIIVESIRTGATPWFSFKESISKIRSNHPKKDSIKKWLPGFTPTGVFEGTRKTENMIEYSGIIQIDIDHIDSTEISRIKKDMTNDSYVLASFVSVGGEGFKILIQTNGLIENHTESFKQVCDYVDQWLGVKCDRAVKSIAQQCYFSYDPDIYFNPKAQLFKINSEVAAVSVNIGEIGAELESIFNKAESIVRKEYTFEKGSRNIFIYNLGCILNKYGVDIETAITLITDRYVFDEQKDDKEIVHTIHSAYKNPDHGTWKTDLNIDHEVKPEEIIENLPPFLREVTELFKEGHEQITFLLGALTIVSGCFPMVWGEYDNKNYYPNLYLFVIAPAASGKGVINFSKKLANALNDKVFRESKKEQEEFNIHEEIGLPPPTRTLFIAGNNSSAGIINDLCKNRGLGIVSESEADTIGNNFSREWGNFSTTLREAFHHESINFSRKGNDENITIDSPKLSLCLTSTPSQIYSIMKSHEDGLFSRFMYYQFQPKTEWISPRPSGKSNAEDIEVTIAIASEMILKLNESLLGRNIQFRLKDYQWDQFDQFYSDELQKVYTGGSKEFRSTVIRMGLITFRIAMVLTIARNINGIKGEQLICEDIDFENALELSKMLLQNAKKILTKYSKPSYSKNQIHKIVANMSESFQASDFISSVLKTGISERTGYRLLKEYNGIYWKKKNKIYHKIHAAKEQ